MGLKIQSAYWGENKDLIYLTYSDGYSGIFAGQVCDVCNVLSQKTGRKVLLISFVPYVGFFKQRRQILGVYQNVVVFPMIPSRVHWWQLFSYFLGIFLLFRKDKTIIGRGVLATLMALQIKGKRAIVYDGRGAENAQWKEYQGHFPGGDFYPLEKRAILESDFRIAVSEKLKEHWRNDFDYTDNKHVIIPCTMSSFFQKELPTESQIAQKRKEFSFEKEDIIFIYSGSAQGWQSFSMLDELVSKLLSSNERVRFLLLSKLDLSSLRAYQKFPERIKSAWVKPHEVFELLTVGDYGILMRERTVTNQVASPTKFAEYLAAGLQVLISDQIGDYSDLVEKEHLGQKIDPTMFIRIVRTTKIARKRAKDYAHSNFMKKSYSEQYNKIISFNNSNNRFML